VGLSASVSLQYGDPVLNDLANPLSLGAVTNSVTTTGGVWTSSWDAQPATRTVTSPEGRTAVSTHDDNGRVIKVETPGLRHSEGWWSAPGQRLDLKRAPTHVGTLFSRSHHHHPPSSLPLPHTGQVPSPSSLTQM
jgi:hypothetical protein